MLVACRVQSSPLTFHYVIVSRNRRVSSRAATDDVATVRASAVKSAASSDSARPSPLRTGRSLPDHDTKRSTAATTNDDSVDVIGNR